MLTFEAHFILWTMSTVFFVFFDDFTVLHVTQCEYKNMNPFHFYFIRLTYFYFVGWDCFSRSIWVHHLANSFCMKASKLLRKCLIFEEKKQKNGQSIFFFRAMHIKWAQRKKFVDTLLKYYSVQEKHFLLYHFQIDRFFFSSNTEIPSKYKID